MGLAQGMLRAARQCVGDVPMQLYGGHELEKDWTTGPCPPLATERKKMGVCPEGGASN